MADHDLESSNRQGLILRPNGMIERLVGTRPGALLAGYALVRTARASAASLPIAARADRRRQRRPGGDPLKGRLLDIMA